MCIFWILVIFLVAYIIDEIIYSKTEPTSFEVEQEEKIKEEMGIEQSRKERHLGD